MNQTVDTNNRSDESVVSKISERIKVEYQEKIVERDEIKGYVKNIANGYGNKNGESISSFGAKVSYIEGQIETYRQIQSIISQEVEIQ